ncbi:uncharacterized protein LOC123273011 [Cotesia glomerata]|uniref:uncharacterized protein LOC123273011 n=1 Tax=Cotesia glomerata TaxID=32391 RepID=UPI001D012EBD|nr:uncharacterized protein LOC123273011 [Cotesia glomerata]
MDKRIFYRSNKPRLKIPEKIIEGFGYNCYRTYKDVCYVRCYERSSQGCYACGQIKNGRLTLTVNHEHENDPKLILYAVFQEELYNATISRPYRSFRSIYDHFCQSHYEAARIYTWAKMQPLMDVWRRRNRPVKYPPIPRDLQHYVILLDMQQYHHLTVYPQGQLSFSTLQAPDNSFLTIFYDLNFVSLILTSTLLMDGTFRSTPKKPKVYQLFTIIALTNDKALLVCWMLMQKKSAAAYQTGLQFFKNHVAAHIVPDHIMTDFESGLRSAIEIIYPEAHHNGCFFHYCQALMKRLKVLKLFKDIQKWKYGQIIIRKFMGLAFLPADDITRAYNWLLNAIPENIKNRLHGFIVYFHDEWIVRTPPIFWSVINLDNRTNNFTESYNKKANVRFGVHPSIWKFTEKLTNLQAVTRIELESLNDGEEITRQRQEPEEIYRESKIKRISEFYCAGRLNFANFFACISNVSPAFRANRYFDIEGNPDDNNYANLPIFLEVDVMDLHLDQT